MKLPFSRTIKSYLRTLYINRYFKGWKLSQVRRSLFFTEFENWKQNYIPFPLKDKTVLDVGAGEGETALFFLLHGAKKVICVEPDPKCFGNLLCNASRFNIIPVLSPFNLTMLDSFSFDFMKMDIEGYEESLLTVDLDRPAVVEIHGLQQREKFKRKGYTVVNRSPYELDDYFTPTCTTYGFYKCKQNIKGGEKKKW
jgi:predicted RNA methylase